MFRIVKIYMNNISNILNDILVEHFKNDRFH